VNESSIALNISLTFSFFFDNPGDVFHPFLVGYLFIHKQKEKGRSAILGFAKRKDNFFLERKYQYENLLVFLRCSFLDSSSISFPHTAILFSGI
jgi:hypothetical protein